MANTYEAIATVTVGSGGAANIEFTSIPATYTDLCMVMSLRFDGNNDLVDIAINNSTANRSQRYFYGNGASVVNVSNTDLITLADNSTMTANTFSNCQIYIPNYASSNNKSFSIEMVSETNGTTAYTVLSAGLWSNSAAITSLKLSYSGYNFVQYSTATLYGIKKN
jgi:hypothetical protein